MYLRLLKTIYCLHMLWQSNNVSFIEYVNVCKSFYVNVILRYFHRIKMI